MKRVVLSILSATFGVLCVAMAAAGAAEVTGTVKKIAAAKNTVVVTVDGTDKAFSVTKDASFTSVMTAKNKKGKVTETVQTIDTLTASRWARKSPC